MINAHIWFPVAGKIFEDGTLNIPRKDPRFGAYTDSIKLQDFSDDNSDSF